MKPVALVALPLAVAAALSPPAAAAPFTLERVMSAPFCDLLVAAERAPRIAWAVNQRGERNVWAAEAPAWRPHPVTHFRGDTGMELAALALSPDGKTAVFARGGDGDRTPNPASLVKPPKRQVLAAATDGTGEPRVLGEGGDELQLSPDGTRAAWVVKKQLWIAPVDASAPAHAVTELEGTVNHPRWSPDGKRLAFEVDRDTHALTAVLDVDGETVRWIAPSTDLDAVVAWSPDGHKLAFVRMPASERKRPIVPVTPSPWAVWVADAATGKAHPVWQSGGAARDSLPPPDLVDNFLSFVGNRVVFPSEQDGRLHLYAVDTAANAAPARRLTTGDFDVEQVRVAPDHQSLLFTSNQGDAERRHAWRVPADGSAPPQPISRGDGVETAPVQAADGSVFVLAATARQPGLPARVRAGALEPIARELVPPEFPERDLIAPQPVTFRAADGVTVHADLFLPPSCKTGCRAVVFSHGGPIRQMMPAWHYLYYYANAYAENQYLASQGIAVIAVNYRCGIMYGRDFREAPNTGWRGAAEYQDVVAAAGYLASLPQIDRKRIGLWGGSYGGLLTALGLARNSDLFKAGVDFHGVHDWSTLIEHGEDGSDRASDKQAATELAFKSSPVADVARWRSPVLFIHGDDDRNVPFDQTTDLVARLRARGVRLEEVVYPDEIHDLLLHRDWLDAYQATAAFFAREL